MNSLFNIKHPTFDKWKVAIWNTVKIFDKDNFEYTRADCTTQILKFFLSWNKNHKNNKDLLDSNRIKKFNSLINENSNV